MSTKQEMLANLKEEFQSWQTLLASKTEQELTATTLPDNWSVKDVIAHVHEWQRVSIARLEAAQSGGEPTNPDWFDSSIPESDEAADQFNTLIYSANKEQSWQAVYEAWRNGFQHFIELGEEIPDTDLMDATKYAWLDGYALYDVLDGSYEHHTEHRDELIKQLAQG